MKTLIPTLLTTTALALGMALPLTGQEALQLPPPRVADYASLKRLLDTVAVFSETGPRETPSPAPVTPPPAEEGPAYAEAQLQRHLEEAEAQLEHQLAEVERAVELAQAVIDAPVAPVAVPGAPPRPATAAVHANVASLLRRGPSKALVIRSGDLAADTQANLEEDLSVMSRILEKGVEQKIGDDDAPRAAGIPVFFTPDGGSMRSLYLEGYGAIFMLNVRFPLVPPAEKTEEDKPKSETDSAWNKAKDEIYGQHDEWGEFGKALKFGLGGGGEPQEYDTEKVDRLRQSLIEALKNATNIRHLKSDESITVCVFGGVSAGPGKVATTRRVERDSGARKRGEDRSKVFVDARDERGANPRGTVMTLRVKKSDVDAFAKGKLDLDGFTKKVSVTSYPADTGAWGGGGWFGGIGR